MSLIKYARRFLRLPSAHTIGVIALGALASVAFERPDILVSYFLTACIVWTLVCAQFGWLK